MSCVKFGVLTVESFLGKESCVHRAAQHRVHRTSAGAARTFGEAAPMADLASGGFVRQLPRLPVTPAVSPLG